MKWGAERMISAGSGGSVINIGSRAATRPFPERALYCGTKGAVLQMTRAAALDVARHQIRVNLVSPGTIDTWLLRKTRFADVADQESEVQALGLQQPFGTVGQPIDVARAALFFASDEMTWVTGAHLAVDSGHAL